MSNFRCQMSIRLNILSECTSRVSPVIFLIDTNLVQPDFEMKRDGTAVAAAATYTLIFWADVPSSIMLIQAGATKKATALILILDGNLSF